MFKLVIVLLALVALSLSNDDRRWSTTPIPIIYQHQEGPNSDGSYSWSYSTANHIKAKEVGYVKHYGSKHEAMSVRGSYSYTAPDGSPVQLSYVADENGFRAKSNQQAAPPSQTRAIMDWITMNRNNYY